MNKIFVGEDGDRSPGALSIDEKNKHENDSDISITDSSDERIGKNSNIWIPLIYNPVKFSRFQGKSRKYQIRFI